MTDSLRLTAAEVREILGWDFGYPRRGSMSKQEEKAILAQKIKGFQERPFGRGPLPGWAREIGRSDITPHRSGAVTIANPNPCSETTSNANAS